VLRYLNFEVLFLQEKPNKLLEVMSIQSQDKLIKRPFIFLCIQIPVKVRAIDPLRFSTPRSRNTSSGSNRLSNCNFIMLGESISIGEGGDLQDPESDWAQRMGVSLDGAVLVRPDGFVAWRSNQPMSTPQQLDQVLSRILCRSTRPISTLASKKQVVSG